MLSLCCEHKGVELCAADRVHLAHAPRDSVCAGAKPLRVRACVCMTRSVMLMLMSA